MLDSENIFDLQQNILMPLPSFQRQLQSWPRHAFLFTPFAVQCVQYKELYVSGMRRERRNTDTLHSAELCTDSKVQDWSSRHIVGQRVMTGIHDLVHKSIVWNLHGAHDFP